MKKNKIKVKYILGTYKDSPDFPSREDLIYLSHNWYYNEGGKQHIENHTSVENIKFPVFTESDLISLTSDEVKKSIVDHIEKMINEKLITIVKQTQHNIYYSFETNHYA